MVDNIKKMVVLGDSFMRPDPFYAGQHWSEMLSGYEVKNMAIDGASTGIILYQFWKAIEQGDMDCMVIGMTAEARVEFDRLHDESTAQDVPFVTQCLINDTTKGQQDLAETLAVHVSTDALLMRTYTIMRCMFMTLQEKSIPFAWTPMILDNNLNNPRFATEPWQRILGEFECYKTPLNLATWPGWTAHPSFHVDDPVWQLEFSHQVTDILERS